MKEKIKTALWRIWEVTGWLYFPFYWFFWALNKVARVALAITYFGMLDFNKGRDIIKYLFNYAGRH